MTGQANCALRIGAFELRPERGVLLLGDSSFHLEPKVCDVLCRLARHPGDTVTREALLDDVWGRSFGADESLTRAISLLRKTFKSDAERLYIETVPKRGYRLVAPVTELTAADRVEEGVEGYHGHSAEHSVLPLKPPPSPDTSVAAPRASASTNGLDGRLMIGLSVLAAVLTAAVVVLLMRGGAPASAQATEPGEPDDIVAVASFVAIGRDDAAAEAGFLTDQLTSRMPALLSVNGVRAVPQGSPALPRYELSGSVEANGNTLMADLRLAAIETGEVIWTMSVERGPEMANTLAQEAGARFAGALGCALGFREEGEQFAAPLLARMLAICDGLRMADVEGLTEHARFLEIEDPNRSRALALAAILLERHATHSLDEDGDEYEALLEKARNKAREATEQSSDSPLADVAVAITLPINALEKRDKRLRWSSNTQGTARTYALWRRAEFYREVGRISDAIELYNTILQHDPYHPTASAELAWLHRTLGRNNAAARRLEETLRLDPEHAVARQRQFMMRMQFSPVAEAKGYLRDGMSEKMDKPEMMVCLSAFVDLRERLDRSVPDEISIAEFEQACRTYTRHFVARLLGTVGFETEARAELDAIISASPDKSKVILYYPEYEALRRDPSFWNLFQQAGLPSYWLSTDTWPDFCRLEDLGYDCRAMAREISGGDA